MEGEGTESRDLRPVNPVRFASPQSCIRDLPLENAHLTDEALRPSNDPAPPP